MHPTLASTASVMMVSQVEDESREREYIRGVPDISVLHFDVSEVV